MSGMIGVIAQDTARYSIFGFALTYLNRPVNTTIQPVLTTDRVAGRNKVVEIALEQGAEWVLFLDDDHAFSPDFLTRLLAHDVPMVGGLYLKRGRPFEPIAYDRKDDNAFYPIDLTALPADGLYPVLGLGTGGCLIRSEVFRAVGSPWFEYGPGTEDLLFCNRAIEEGFPIYVDLGARMGHLTVAAIWPSWVDEEWAVGFSVADNLSLYVPIEKPAEVVEAAADAVRR